MPLNLLNDYGLIILGGLAWCWLVYNPIPAWYYMKNVKTGQLCANPFSTQENTKDGGCIHQRTTVFAARNDCFVDNFSAVIDLTFNIIHNVLHRQNTLIDIIVILVSKENHIKKQLLLRQQRKTIKKKQYWFRNCRSDKWWVDMMLAVAVVEKFIEKKLQIL